MYYRSKCSGKKPVQLIADFTLSRLIKKYIRDAFEEKGVSVENNEELWKHYFQKFSNALNKSYSPTLEFYDEDLGIRLKQNIAQFSAFKAESFKKNIESLLVDENNHIATWKEFEKKATALDSEYNGRYLETEYNHTIATGNITAKLEDFKANVHLYPNLKIVTVNDGRVRPEHKVLDGVIKPYNDPFWNNHIPPFDWGCRCDIEQTDEEPTDGTPDYEIKDGFANNPVQSGKIFQSEAYTVDFTDLEKDNISIRSLQLLAQNSDSKLQEFAREKILDLPRTKQFEILKKSDKGEISEHLLLNRGEDYPNIKKVAELFLKQGSKQIELLPEINSKNLARFRSKVFPDYDLIKNPDLRIDKNYYDVKRVENLKNIQRNANRASNQNAVAVIDYLGDDLTEEKMLQQSKRIFGKNNVNDKGEHQYKQDKIYFSYKGKLYKYNRE